MLREIKLVIYHNAQVIVIDKWSIITPKVLDGFVGVSEYEPKLDVKILWDVGQIGPEYQDNGPSSKLK